MKRAKFLLQKFPQYATDCVLFRDEKVFSVTSPDNQQNNVSGRLRELLKNKISVFLSAGTALSATAAVPVSRNFLNTLLTPRFVQLFWGNSSVNLFALNPFKYKLFIKLLSSSLNIMLIVDKRYSDACGDEFPMPQIDRHSKEVKEQWHGKFYLQSVQRKIRYCKHRKYRNLWMNNKGRGD